jgi:hypothetical protein
MSQVHYLKCIHSPAKVQEDGEEMWAVVASLNAVGAMQPVLENMVNRLLALKAIDIRTLQRYWLFALLDTLARRTILEDLDEDAIIRVYIYIF